MVQDIAVMEVKRKVESKICSGPRYIKNYIQQFISRHAKLCAICLVLVSVVYNQVDDIGLGMDSCSTILSNGSYRGEREWQPTGCMMHNYSNIQTIACLRYVNNKEGPIHFVFGGDSRMREQYLTFINRIDPREDEQVYEFKSDFRSFINAKYGFKSELFWCPVSLDPINEHLASLKQKGQEPTLVIAGNGVWAVASYYNDSMEYYAGQLERFVAAIKPLTDNNRTVLWKVQQPLQEDRVEIGFWMQNNQRYEFYRQVAYKIVSRSGARFWSSSKLVVEGDIKYMRDPLHFGMNMLKIDVQVLVNWFCNDHMNYIDGTCCSRSDSTMTLVQAATFLVLGLSVLIVSIWKIWNRLKIMSGNNPFEYTLLSDPSQQQPHQDPYTLVTSLAKLGLIMGYFFVCDRTDFFGRENKHFTEMSFFLPLGCLLAVGVVFNKQSEHSHVLHRDQTDEWKGWMQLVILVYHITGASKVLSIYKNIRILVSAYIFLSGYNQMSHFWRTGDTSIVRLFQVMFRLNFMVVLLCFCMDRPYNLYYFVPLISVCYLTFYILVVIPPHVTEATVKKNFLLYLWLFLKFVGLFSLITAFYNSRWIFDRVFLTQPLKALFATVDGEDHDWWFRCNLDRYSIIYGMAFAVMLATTRRRAYPDNHYFTNIVQFIALILAINIFRVHFSYAGTCSSKTTYNEIHPYLTIAPIVGYIILRNVSHFLRCRYSTFFAFFGRISLELFIGQYHIWLAADSRGVLTLIPGYPVLNTVITTAIFICVAHEMHQITTAVQQFVVPNDLKLVLGNVVIFAGVLVLIDVYKG